MVALILCFCMSAIKYEQEIFRVLTEAGEEGLSVQKIALHVYNSCNSLFNPVSYEEVYGFVSRFLIAKSRKQHSLIERTASRGVYHLNFTLKETQQLMLQFKDATEVEEPKAPMPDNSLSLF